jgi:DNA-binding transcriptional MerR regulator
MLLTVSSVARQLGVTPSRVRQLDDELHPERTDTGVRLYTAAAVAEYLARRKR